jgi:hypothetical protein
MAALAGCGPDPRFGEWTTVQTRQFAVPLSPGTTAVEVEHTSQGWTERITVESDGREVTRGVPVERARDVSETPMDADRAAFFDTEVDVELPEGLTPVRQAIALRDWVTRRTFGRGSPLGSDLLDAERGKADPLQTTDGRAILEDIDRGAKFNCQSVANILYDVARTHKLRARRMDLAVRHLSPHEGHAIVEFWSDADGGWVVMDPTFNCHYEVAGRLAGALELHKLVTAKRFSEIRLVREPGAAGADPFTYRTNPLLYFRNLYVPLPSGDWLTRVDDATPPALLTSVTFLDIAGDDPFTTVASPVAGLEVRRGALHDRLAYEAVGGTLYVCVAENLFEFGALRVRATKDAEVSFHQDIPALDARDESMFLPGELAANGALADSDGDTVPDGWIVNGQPTLARTPDGLAIEGGSGEASIELQVPLAPMTPVAAFGRLRVERGKVTFGVRNKRDGDAFPYSPGPLRDISSRILTTRRDQISVRLDLEPGARCVVERISLRRVRTLGELLQNRER